MACLALGAQSIQEAQLRRYHIHSPFCSFDTPQAGDMARKLSGAPGQARLIGCPEDATHRNHECGADNKEVPSETRKDCKTDPPRQQAVRLLSNRPKGLTLKNTLKYSMLALLVVFGTSTLAFARDNRQPPPPPPPPTHCDPPSAPEVDPSLAISGLTLLAGTLTLARVARRK
jgi:hypothetical protein